MFVEKENYGFGNISAGGGKKVVGESKNFHYKKK